MRDKLVSLAIDDAKSAAGARVGIDVWTDVPDPVVRLRLWDSDGRNPTPAEWDAKAGRWSIGVVRPGCTLTWSVRLASEKLERFELRLRVYQGDAPLPGGHFSYSGPLEGLEERSGRFHFAEAPKPSG
jgi:hypothetical protein